MGQYHILVVEDDNSLRRIVREFLELSNYQVYAARNGREGLEILEWLRADLIVSDIMMPVMDGYEFYQQVRTRPDWLNIPFIFLSAKGDKLDVLEGKKLGVDDYVVKPFDSDELLVTVASKLAIAERWQRVQELELKGIKRRILNTLHHEFRTPLTYISAYTELLVDSGGQLNEKDFHEFCQAILAGSNRLRELVEDLLLLAELESGEIREAFESRRSMVRDLSLEIHELIRSFEPAAGKKGLSIQYKSQSQLPPIVADTELLTNAIRRLVDNAIKFSPKGADQVEVMLGATDNHLQLSVHDHGIGIRPEEIGELFKVLHQIERDKMEQQGSGSGLAIAKAIVTLHGGDITVESEPGQGSVFTILLPAVTGETRA